MRAAAPIPGSTSMKPRRLLNVGGEAHVESAHFKKYFATTKGMITSRRLIDTVPVQLSAKNK